MFTDEAIIKVKAGDGGDGVVSFRREKYVPKGGPDGGDGGDGGSIFMVGQNNIDTLSQFATRKSYQAQNGARGMRKKMHGKNGQDLYLKVPLGTKIYQSIDHKINIISDIITDEDEILLVKGGKGGLGNDHFKSSTNQAPREFTYGEKGETKKIKLVLELIADIGLVGLPSSGKSTLINQLTNTQSKIGNYPFTTIHPKLGVLSTNTTKKPNQLVIADIPGLIKDASKGKGLGIKFLKHISRTKTIAFVLDASSDVKKDYSLLIEEIKAYDPKILQKNKIIIINKIDLVDNKTINKIKRSFLKEKPIFISAKDAVNIDKLINILTNNAHLI